MRLIDAEKLCLHLADIQLANRGWKDDYCEMLDDIISIIDEQTTIEADPVRHGRCDMCETMEKGHGRIRLYHGNGWQVAIDRGVDGYELVISHCGEHFATKIDYCPYCGAKMEGKNEDGID